MTLKFLLRWHRKWHKILGMINFEDRSKFNRVANKIREIDNDIKLYTKYIGS